MAQFSDRPVTVGGMQVSGRGVRGEVFEGVQRSAGARAMGTFDPLDSVLQEVADVEVRAASTVDIQAAARGVRRDGVSVAFDETPTIELEGPEAPHDEAAQIAITEEDGYYNFFLPNPGTTNQFDIPVETSGREAERGLGGKFGQMAVRIIGVMGVKKLVEKATELAVRSIETQKRPHGIRPFGPDDCSKKTTEPVDLEHLASGPSLLLIHGTNSSSHTGFRFSRAYVERLNRRYGDRVFAFDHPSLSYSPEENARWLLEYLEDKGARIPEVDVVAHSRGGLVARWMTEKLRSDVLGVRSVLFVATPNAGTPLADGDHLGQFISITTSLMNVLPDNVITDGMTIGLEVLKEYVLGAAFRAIEGVSVMNPSSEVLAELNANSQPNDVTYRAIAANFEPRSDHGALRRARDFAMDTVFGGRDNDLVVPTRSAYARTGEFQVGTDARMVLDSSFGIDHSTFWNKEMVLDRLDQWLDPSIQTATEVPAAYTDPVAEFEMALQTGSVTWLQRATGRLSDDQLDLVTGAVGGPVATWTRAEVSPKGSVIVLPGIMGSSLTVDGHEVWVNKWQLLRGRFAHLEVNGDGRRVEPSGLLKQYAPLVSHLAGNWQVFTVPYDWRRDITEAADLLAERIEHDDVRLGEQEVHIVAHSMGGLVARAFVAKHPDLWERVGGRLIQLGTPNWGSFAIANALMGEELLLRALAFADVFHDKQDLVEVLSTFPGAYQLLPWVARTLPDGNNDHAGLYNRAAWGEDTSIRQELLDRAKTFQQSIEGTVDPSRVIFIAGDGHRTPYRLRIEASGQISLGITEHGDGRVPHDFGFEGLDVPTFFSGARHGDLASAPDVLKAIDELLSTGSTTVLPTQPAVRRADARDVVEWVPLQEVEFRLGNSTSFQTRAMGVSGEEEAGSAIDQALGLYVGTGEPVKIGAQPLRVRVVHASLEQARYPVAVGWYKGLPIDGALSFIDWRFGGALGRRLELGLYPEEGGTAIYVAAPGGSLPKGAIVLGLGEFGQLTPTRLTAAVEEGTLRYALETRASDADSGGIPTIGVAAVLAGAPGRYGLGLETALLALITGVARASAKLADAVTISDLEIIEIHEGIAEQTASVLRRIADSPTAKTLDVPIEPVPILEPRPGGRPGIGDPEESGPAWPRVQLEFENPRDRSPTWTPEDAESSEPGSQPDPIDTSVGGTRSEPRELTYIGLTRRAQADHFSVKVDTEGLRRLVGKAVSESRSDSQINNTLYELLLPNPAKLGIEELDNLHLLVDESTAWIPWEVLAGHDRLGVLQPLALRTGLLRQLKPTYAEQRLRMPPPIGKQALVIGDPPAGERFPRLDGAQREARRVAEILRTDAEGAGYEVTSRIYGLDAESSEADEIRNDFFARPYRIIHIAAHGVFDEGSVSELAVGVVIGEDDRLSALDFQQRSTVPDLVFLNCCHIGRIDDASSEKVRGRFSDLAASVALELMRSGVKAVVAAGWAVDDRAAEAFATTFYEQMISGSAFGDAVFEARQAARIADGGRSNTWGAYQCYGDPGFHFYETQRFRSDRRTFTSPNQFVIHLKTEKTRAADASDNAYALRMADELAELVEAEGERFESGPVFEAIAEAYDELGRFDYAIDAYRRAVGQEDAGASLRSIERLANLEARLAAAWDRKDPPADARIADRPEELFVAAQDRLEWLMGQNETAERHVLFGSFHKKRATWRDAEDDRVQDVASALDHYRRATDLSRRRDELNIYHADLAIQMASLLYTSDDGLSPYEEMLIQLQRQVQDIDESVGDYFARARSIDVVACEAVLHRKLASEETQEHIIGGFAKAFGTRSTPRQRWSVIDNYWDLSLLLETHQERSGESPGAKTIAERLEAHGARA